jgi:tetratricopeptide (TPR) repeat protein
LTPAQPEDVQRDLGAPYFRIGAAAIYPGSAIHSFRSAAVRIEGDVEQNGVLKVRGYLTAGLMEVLANQDPRTLDYLTWAEAARIPEKPTMFSDHLEEPIFANYIGHAAARAKFRRLDQRPFRRMIPTLERLIERAPQRPHLYVDLGLALAAIDEPEKALARLRTAVNLYDDPTIFEQESQLDPMAWEVQRQARYHLGRLLYEQKTELGKAVEELRKARDQDPTDARVQYYLGQSIRSLVERENLREAQLALQAYLDKGAPLGHKEEVQQFVVRSSKSTDVRPIAPENSPSPIRFD